MSIDSDEVERIAELARIDVQDGEIEALGEELTDILEYVDKLDELETDEVEPTTHAVLQRMIGDEDETEGGLSRDEVLGNAPDEKDGQFRVPKTVE